MASRGRTQNEPRWPALAERVRERVMVCIVLVYIKYTGNAHKETQMRRL